MTFFYFVLFLLFVCFYFYLFSTINILSWNCRGAGARSFPRLIQDFRVNYGVQVLIINEPRVSGGRAGNIIARMGFDKSYRIEVQGFSGGIWILWDGSSVSVDIVNSSSQFIYANLIYRKGGESFYITCVYGTPIPSIRQGLWE